MTRTSPTNDAIRLALVTTELGVGGAERCICQLAKGLAKADFKPVVYALATPPRAGQDHFVKQLQSHSITVRFLGMRHSAQFPLAVRKLRQLLQQQSPHIVQCFLFHANVVGTLAAARAGVPRVFAGLRVAEPVWWRWHLQRLAALRIERFVCVSQSVADYAVNRYRLPREKMHVIANAVDADDLGRREPVDLRQLGLSANRRAIICVARLDRQKGIDWLLRLAPRLFSQLPNHDLLLVGTGPSAKAAQATVRANQLVSRIHFLGWRGDVPEILRASDLLVLPSRWEGMPHVLLEAMACGLPVVASRVEGVAEVLGQLVEHQTVDPHDETSFVDSVVMLAKNRDLARSLGHQNRQHVTENFSLDQLCTAYAELYRTPDQCHRKASEKK